MIQTGILTISDQGAQGLRLDEGGPRIQSLLPADFYQIAATAVVPDEIPSIVETLVAWADQKKLDLIFTTGGTGLSPQGHHPRGHRPGPSSRNPRHGRGHASGRA